MAREYKESMDYFPLDVHVDDKLKYVKMKYGFEGYGILVALFQYVYSNSFYCEWNDEILEVFCFDNHIDPNKMRELFQFFLEKNIFSNRLYQKFAILTSNGIQKHYAEVSKRRKGGNVPNKEYIINEKLMEILYKDEKDADSADIQPKEKPELKQAESNMSTSCIHHEVNEEIQCKQDDSICTEREREK